MLDLTGIVGKEVDGLQIVAMSASQVNDDFVILATYADTYAVFSTTKTNLSHGEKWDILHQTDDPNDAWSEFVKATIN